MKGYIKAIKDIYSKFKDDHRLIILDGVEEFKEEIRKITNKYRTKHGYHRVLTELAFLEIRTIHMGRNHGIIPVLLNGDNIDYLPFFRTDDPVWISLNPRLDDDEPATLMSSKHKAFFKLVQKIYADKEKHIDVFKICYQDCIKIKSNILPTKLMGKVGGKILKATEDIQRMAQSASRTGPQLLHSSANNFTTSAQQNRCLAALRITDPQMDKKRIEETKGGLLENVSNWIFDNSDFQQWRSNQDNRLLWIKGDPGKGKTMLLCGIINKLQRSDETALAYFFCQGTDVRINSAVAVLRGLIYMLLDRQPAFLSHLQKRYEKVGEQLFKDANTFTALSEILKDILYDKSLKPTILIIDALDECQEDLLKLLRLIASSVSEFPRVKWLVSSRNWPQIEEELGLIEQGMPLSLELNAQSVSVAVDWYVQDKMDKLSRKKKRIEENRKAVESYLLENANGTFLWVALVCQNLQELRFFTTSILQDYYPPELNPLYKRMLQQILDIKEHGVIELCLQLIAIVVVAFRPITLCELACLIGSEIDLKEIIQLCGSFLVIRNQSIFFVHKSAKDFLSKKAAETIFPNGIGKVNEKIFLNSITEMSNILKENIYGLHYSGFPINKIKQPDPDPLVYIRYSCTYWVNHFIDGNPPKTENHIQNNGKVYNFLTKHLLHWLEVMSLMENISGCIVTISSLENYISVEKAPELSAYIHDAKHFALYNRIGIE
ncbi:hypothetical protein EAF04_009512 [Stromatinia cepivora]|nr:hypothetical protein EAF04_009512 [Stromatinia cepivora]